MKFTKKMLEEINRTYMNNKTDWNKLDLRVSNSLNDATICRYSGGSGWAICDISDLEEHIQALTDMKKALEEAAGVLF